MKFFPSLLGNEELRMRLATDVREETLSHAYIIEGPLGSGKHTLAKELAAALACKHSSDESLPLPCTLCPSCRKILGRKSPDVITVSREEGKAQLGVDIIRGLRSDVRVVPNDLDIKVYIIEDAHTMNIQAQNAFLLTLEEPPKFVLFFLLAESSAPLLETIKSRAPILRMSPLSEELIAESIVKMSPEAASLKKASPEEFLEIIKLSSGYLGQALTLLDEKKRRPRLAARQLAKKFLTEMATKKNGKSALELIESFSPKRDEIIKQLSEIEHAARDLTVVKKCETAPLCFFTGEDEAAELSFSFKTSELLCVMRSLELAKSRLEGNANVRLTIFALAIDCGLI